MYAKVVTDSPGPHSFRSGYGQGHFTVGLILLWRGDLEGALTEMQQEATNDESQQGGLVMAYYALGRQADSDAALNHMIHDQAGSNAFGIAEVCAFRGLSDEAMRWLDRAYIQKDPFLYTITDDLPLGKIAAASRFKAFLRKLNLPESKR